MLETGERTSSCDLSLLERGGRMRECESETAVTSSSYLSESEAGSESPGDSQARTERPQTEVGQQPRLAGRQV